MSESIATEVAKPLGEITATSAPSRQLSDLPKDELEHLAEEFGLDPTRYKSRQALVAAIHDRRQLIAGFDREAMLDVVRWGRRPVTVNATKEQIALEIVRIKSMRFAGLSQRGLVVLARLRGVNVTGGEPVPVLVRKLKRQEGLFQKLNRKRRAWIGSMIAKMIGESEPGASADYQFLPPPGGSSSASGAGTTSAAPRQASVREEIEESGLIGGLTNRIKKTADSYLNQKLDEIEARIDRKLDEIDRRLAEWRDKEIANRIRILKITLWASVIVSVISLMYSYVSIYIWPKPTSAKPSPPPPARVVEQQPPQK
jgi:hypothetical protein